MRNLTVLPHDPNVSMFYTARSGAVISKQIQVDFVPAELEEPLAVHDIHLTC